MEHIEGVDPREEKLPRWVQEKLADARRRVREAENDAKLARLQSGPADSDTILEPWGGGRDTEPIKLGKGAEVRFLLPSGYIDVQVGRDHSTTEPFVRLSAERAVSIVPQSSNVVRIRNGKY
jgi:hypothetical protein